MDGRVFYVGTDHEVAHHAGPLAAHVDLRIAEPWEVQSAARPGDVAVFYSEHFDRFRSLCVWLKQQNVATLYAIDGILEWRNAWVNRPDEIACPWTMRPCLSHVVAAIGPRQQAVLQSWGNDPVLPVGLPRLDALCQHRGTAAARVERSAADGDAAGTAGDGAAKFRVLVLTAKCPGFTAAQIETTFQSLNAVHSAVRAHPRIGDRPIELIWRLTGGLAQRLGVAEEPRSDQMAWEATDLPSLVRSCHAVITTPSTAMLEAMLCDRPVAILDFHNTPIYAEAVFRITAAEQIVDVLHRLAQFSASPAAQHLQAFLLRENLYADGHATSRMVSLLAAMQVQSRAAAERGQLWRFDPTAWLASCSPPWDEDGDLFWKIRPRRIVAGPTDPTAGESAASEFSARDLAAAAPATPLTLPQWQAYTEQLERENKRLGRLVQEAQDVFDHMQRHPVLGTILKSHQWWSRWWHGSAGRLAKPESWNEP